MTQQLNQARPLFPQSFPHFTSVAWRMPQREELENKRTQGSLIVILIYLHSVLPVLDSFLQNPGGNRKEHGHIFWLKGKSNT